MHQKPSLRFQEEVKISSSIKQKNGLLTPWERVQISRKKDRPVAEDYIEKLFTHFYEFHGDRSFGDDSSILGGIALFHGIPVTVIAQSKGHDTKENIQRNFGMPNPEGYASILFKDEKMAEKSANMMKMTSMDLFALLFYF